MAELVFEDLQFKENGRHVDGSFLQMFSFQIPKEKLRGIGKFSVQQQGITFPETSQQRAERKFNGLLDHAFFNLRNRLNNKKTIYLHSSSGIPLIGNGGFGIIDRGTTLLEIKPISSCNIACIFCSVDEDQRKVDVVIEKDYLVEEIKKVVAFKGVDNIELQITSQGETTLYAPLVELIRDVAKIDAVKEISIITNGLKLSKPYIDSLADAGLTRIHLSINAINGKIADKLAGAHYPIKRIMEMAKYVVTKMNLLICPVYVQGVNDDEMVKIAAFAELIGADVGIQNFLPYKFGRNPVNPVGFEAFYEKMKKWQESTSIKLVKDKDDFNIQDTKEMRKPFKKGDRVEAEIVFQGRFPKEMIAVAKGRTIAVPNCRKTGKVKLKITRSKHNIFIGVVS